MFIVSLVFSVLRILFVALGILGYIMMADMVNPPAGFALAIPELLAGVGIIIFGLLGNSLMLARKKIGVTLGAVLVFFVLASTVIGGLQGAAYLSNYNSGSPEWMGAIFGVVFTLIIRVAILIAYVFALLKFNKWLGKQTPTANV